jgi:hypothetical protein
LNRNCSAPRGTARGVIKRIEQIFLDAPGFVLTHNELLWAAYFDDEDGGPVDARAVLYYAIARLRRKRMPIETVGHRGYRLLAGEATRRHGKLPNPAPASPRPVHGNAYRYVRGRA